MQKNPAAELKKILDEWWSKDGPVQTQRIVDNKIDWVRHKEALQYLFDLEKYVDERHPGEFDRLTRAIWHVIFAPQPVWSTQKQDPLNPDQLLNLKTLALLYESEAKIAPVSLSDEARERLRESLEEMGEILGSVSDDFKEDRDRLLEMIRECIELIDDESADLSALRSRTNEATGAAVALTPVIPEEKRKHFFHAAYRAAASWTANATSSAAGNVLSSAASFGLGAVAGG